MSARPASLHASARFPRVFVFVALLLPVLFCPAAWAKDRTGDCRIGIYRLTDGNAVDIGATDGDHLRWRREDGTTGALTQGKDDTWSSTLGWTDKPDGKHVSFDCSKDAITFAGIAGKRIPLDVSDVTFEGAGVKLAGRLILPEGKTRVPIVVLVSGSEDFSARDFFPLQRQFPAAGIGAFVYDKRGTGKSGGTYTQNYLLLANDAIAAMREAKRLAGARAASIGYQGGSQAGWVIPLAAKIEPVDFAIVGYGLAVSPLDEDREAVALDLTDHGFGKDDIAKATQISDAIAAIIVSGFREGYDRLAAVRAKYEHEPWFKYVHGDIAFYFLQNPEAKIREQGPVLLAGVPAQYDPLPVLRNLDTPQLWILAADDHDAPSAETARRLRSLQAQGRPITLAIFPHSEHGILEYETAADGSRVDTRNPDGYFAMMRDFILKERLTQQRYGTSSISFPVQAMPAGKAQ
ncbi:MAG TPA: alpha/beta hydrolase [Rhodanobacteraceae bacterium]|nr:alpha/beta hydrolase [Rhodanobacteraceae bacterium]